MYFYRPVFSPDDVMARRARRDAHQAVLSAARDFGVTLDGTVGSIGSIDAILDRLHRSVAAGELPKEEGENFADIFGSYFGEIVRQAHEAKWGTEPGYTALLSALCVGPTKIVFNPLRWARERVVAGTGRDLQTCYEVLLRSIQAGQAEGSEGDQPIRSGKAGAVRERVFKLQTDDVFFDVGTTADGRLVIGDWDSEEQMTVFFDGAGNLLGYEVRILSMDMPCWAPEYDTLIAQAKQLWKDKLGFRPKPIYIHRFALPDHGIEFQDRPYEYEAFLKAPELVQPDAEKRESMFEQIRQWDEGNNCVFYWGNELWLDAEGEVTLP